MQKASVEFEVEFNKPPENRSNSRKHLKVMSSDKQRRKESDDFINFKWSMANMTHREVPVTESNQIYIKQLQDRK